MLLAFVFEDIGFVVVVESVVVMIWFVYCAAPDSAGKSNMTCRAQKLWSLTTYYVVCV